MRKVPNTVSPVPFPPKAFSRLIEEISVSIPDPLLKLKFINAALDRYQQTCRLMAVAQLNDIVCKQILIELVDRRLPECALNVDHPAFNRPADPPVRKRWTFGAPWLVLLSALMEQGVAEVRDLLHPPSPAPRFYVEPAMVSPNPAPKSWALRGLATAALLALVAFTLGTYRWRARAGVYAQAALTSVATVAAPVGALRAAGSPASLPAAPASAAAVTPEAPPGEVWLVEKKAGYEFYSNGLRISTEYESSGEPRRYRTVARSDGRLSDVKSAPVGLLYHTSEGDVPPFQSTFNRSLAQHTRGLIEYIRQDRLYHYLIDRFGRVYRIVPDAAVAHHAGFSVWSDASDVFILLNQSFIGICFEGRWSEPKADGASPATAPSSPRVITRAQIDAGRQLTDLLRLTHRIADRNCVTHGLASVNPQKHLIGYHLDWATDFPFREMGLSDKYQLPLPSIVEFGFQYDAFFLQVMGKPWPGVDRALEQLRAQAARENIPFESLKRKLNQQFENHLARMRAKPPAARGLRREAEPEEEAPLQGVASILSGQP